MAKLPSVPNLDPNAPPAGSAPPPETAKSEPEGEEVSIDVDLAADVDATAAPAKQAPKGDGKAAAEPAGSGKNRGEGDSLGESVDEMLSQATEQTLALVRLEETISALVETLSDVREEMHAGFTEVREAVAAGQAAPRTDPNLASRIDELDEVNQRGFKKLRGLMVVTLLVCLLLAGGLAASFMSPMTLAGLAKAPPPPPAAAMTELDEDSSDHVGSAPEPAATAAKPKAKKRRRRR